jgi:hypothetical protein
LPTIPTAHVLHNGAQLPMAQWTSTASNTAP